MGNAKPFAINVGFLRHKPGEREEVERSGSLDELCTSGAQVAPDDIVSFIGTLESIEGNRIVAVGNVRATWRGECRRCLTEATGDIDSDVHEIFEDNATEGETYPLERDVADLEPLVREAIMLEIPIAPLCRADCKGLCPECGVDRNRVSCDCVVDLSDPRWAALDILKEGDLKKSDGEAGD